MNQYITGAMLKKMREKEKMTQSDLAQKLNVSDKTVSKWETGRGYPDISLLKPIAEVFKVSVAELLAGSAVENTNTSSNMLRSKFYVCPVCGNVIHAMGEASVSCHGVSLMPLEAEEPDETHTPTIETVEDEYYVSFSHEMSKTHYISFIAAVSSDSVQMIKLYPEFNAQARFRKCAVKALYFYCNKDGLFKIKM